ncbi:MAG: glycerophosphodiester phosphodiesterase [Spirochaetes bacterium]|nr:MAG: glycerophosphodiester phosphodiesterase [Spirochaetota bacterium]
MKMKVGAGILVTLAALVVVVLGIARIMADVQPGRDAAAKLGIPCPAVIAHRGASYLAPEETAPAFILARDLGADYLELDLQRTKDGAIVAFHDDTLERTTNVKEVFPGREKQFISAFNLGELKRLDAGSWFNKQYPDRARPAYADQKILTIEEAVAIAEGGANKIGLYLETKSPERSPGIEKLIVEILALRGWIGPNAKKGALIFQSFDSGSLDRLKELAPSIPRSYLVDEDMAKKESWASLVERASAHSGVGPVGYLAFPWNIGKAHKKGLLVHVYTINELAHFRLFSFFGADGLFTDRCDQLLAYQGRVLPAPPADILKKYGY